MEPVIPFFSIGCFLPIVILIVLGLFVFTVYMLFGGGKKLKVRRRDQTSPQFLREKVPTLVQWNLEQALSDLSSLCVCTGESSGLGGGWSHYPGTVRSLNDWRNAWLAYTVNTDKREGNIVMHSSANKLLVNVSRGRLPRGMRYAEFSIDGQTIGGMNIETRELFDERGRSVGKMRGGKTIIMTGMTNYVTVEIHGREIAQMNTEVYSRLERLGSMPPVFRIYGHQLSEYEQWWLVALHGISLYRDSLTSSV